MRKLSSIVMSAFLTAGAGAAFADETKPGSSPAAHKTGISYPSRTAEINKHITFVDLYLSTAMTNTKALSWLGDGDPGKMDSQLIAEARKNLDGALDRALAHMKHVREYKADLAMVAPGIETQAGSAKPAPRAGGDRLVKLDELETRLKDAKAASKKLGGVRLADLSPAVDGVSSHLVAAQQAFRDISKWTSYTLLEDSNLATVQVKGTSDGDKPPAGPIDRDLGRPSSGAPPPAAGTRGATTTPDVTTPMTAPNPSPVTPRGPTDADKARGKTMPGPGRPEPVKAAPGGGY